MAQNNGIGLEMGAICGTVIQGTVFLNLNFMRSFIVEFYLQNKFNYKNVCTRNKSQTCLKSNTLPRVIQKQSCPTGHVSADLHFAAFKSTRTLSFDPRGQSLRPPSLNQESSLSKSPTHAPYIYICRAAIKMKTSSAK